VFACQKNSDSLNDQQIRWCSLLSLLYSILFLISCSLFSQMTDVLSSSTQWPRSTMPGVSQQQQQQSQQQNYQKNTRRTLPKFKNDTSPRTTSRKITLFRNGDRYFPGKQIAITPQNYSSLGQFLQELSTTIDLPYGVRRLFTPNNGSEITDVNIIKDGASYVCASFEPFQKLEYTAITIPRITFSIEQRKLLLYILS
jgi:hypothetical protein